ncbi:MAG: thiamine phosphate synthase [Muribaculum sp.]|nr:thiamine phosphate synthase [Muribaculum sp.]
MSAFRLQFITHPYPYKSVTEGARLALEGGCRWIQLRHKDANDETLIEEGKTIAELCRACGATFIIDDHVELVKPIGADGVHLGKNDMPLEEARKILGPSYIIGATANTFAELKAAAQSGADYAGVGPFRFTTTKQKLAPVLGTNGYRNLIQQKQTEGIRLPVVAIGGITKHDIPEIMTTGVNGIAASGTILNSPDPAEATAEIIKTINNSITI